MISFYFLMENKDKIRPREERLNEQASHRARAEFFTTIVILQDEI